MLLRPYTEFKKRLAAVAGSGAVVYSGGVKYSLAPGFAGERVGVRGGAV